ncbi:polyprenyl synthetase family protein [Kushneria phyllosphaerae]|uniref:All-trans-nonaprenyl-diphosphate synthase (Geranyl-diphosphate specific) n=1 Tax=Kushneria phyllosphaerae TaxID=2100822 RepID=A0A2R8CQC8_9GAMM|nr:polyprenyl synthetase family protein [Kushneria phyllosphaerae]SPJ35106.1 All-trans-nonaprenyl-diphosphate synthase (geranyl-diphosphate specific) [Kushneria phyllosphaerae]
MTGLTSPIVERQPVEDSPYASLNHDIHATLTQALNNEGRQGMIRDAINHHLAAAGGYLRARLGYHTGQALGLPHESALICACISELLHNASLIHDDVLDHDSMRRGQKSVWNVWNEGVAICLGDLFISAAYGLMAELSTHASRLPALLSCVHHHVQTTIYGQAECFSLAMTPEPDFEQCSQAACGKSGPLFALALEAPLLLTGHDDALDNARQAALTFATIYQLIDDIEDFDSDMIDQQQGACNMLHALGSRGDTTPMASALDYGRHHLSRTRHLAGTLPEGSGQALIEEAHRLEEKLMNVTGERS